MNRGRGCVSSVLDVLEKDGVDRGVGKFSHRFGDALTADFDGDIGVLIKVDTGGLNSARKTSFLHQKNWSSDSPGAIRLPLHHTFPSPSSCS